MRGPGLPQEGFLSKTKGTQTHVYPSQVTESTTSEPRDIIRDTRPV